MCRALFQHPASTAICFIHCPWYVRFILNVPANGTAGLRLRGPDHSWLIKE
jgi:hypothetical protein